MLQSTLTKLGCALVASLCSTPLLADETDPAFKLTVGGYHFSESGSGVDINVRHSSNAGNLWLGYFHAQELDVRQWRAGWDRSFGAAVRIQPSLQVASGGFVGGSLNLEAGDQWIAGLGLGRTNLRPYYNLNFDPNDAWSLTAGYRGADGLSLIASYIRDNRDNPDQRHAHLTARLPLERQQRLTIDVLHKRGLVESRRESRFGATVTYDWPRFSARLAYDPITNFTRDNAWRLSLGFRF